MGLTLVTAPAIEPIDLGEAKAHLRVLSSDEDIYISSLIVVAREFAESFLDRALITQTWDYAIDAFPISSLPISIPRPKLQSVSSVKYIDTNGVEQTWGAANYRVLADGDRGRVALAYNTTYPDIRSQLNAVTVRFVAGYGLPADVPQSIKQAMLLLIGNYFERREATIAGTIIAVVPLAVENLLWPHRSLVMV